jgi:hypothetical protein
MARYVLSPTHLHEYKSADKTQAPLMSLYLPDQKLGSHSADGSSSNKFVLKGRQTGTMHRGHKWVFRAESHDTMMAWYEDIKHVTEQTLEERNNLVRANSRSISRSSQRSSVSSDGVDDDEEPPFTATVASVNQQPRQDGLSRRPSGGRFPSDLQVNAQRGLQVPVSPLSASSGYGESLNHYDTFITTAPTGSDLGQNPQRLQNHGQPRGTEPGNSQRLTAIDGSIIGGPVQFPISAVTTGPQRRSLQVASTPGHSTTTKQDVSPVDREYESQTWAEPVPIPLPLPHQQLSSAMDGGGSEVYDSQDITALNGSRSGNKVGAQTSRDSEKVAAQAGDDGTISNETSARPGGTVRADSTQTISHLHIPGQYPRGSNAGL